MPITEINCNSACYCLDTSADSQLIATGEESGKAVLFEPRSGRLVTEVSCAGAVYAVDLSFDSTLLATGDATGRAIIWSTADGAKVAEMSCGSTVRGVEISYDNAKLATGCEGGNARVWDVQHRECIMEVQCGKEVYGVDLSSDTLILATGDWKRNAKLWDVRTGALVREFKCAHNVYCVKLSDDNLYLATGDAMSKARVWNTATGVCISSMDCAGWVYSVSFSVDSKLLLTGDQGKSVRLWNVSSGQLLCKLECDNQVHSVILSECKGLLMTASRSGKVSVWDMALGDTVTKLQLGEGDVLSVDMDGELISTAGPGKLSSVWHISGALRLQVECKGNAMCIHISRHQTKPVLATGDATGLACLWDIPTTDVATDRSLSSSLTAPEPIATFKCKAVAFAVKVSSDHKWLVTGDVTGMLTIWNVTTGEKARELECGSAVRCVDFSEHPGSQDLHLVVSGTANGVVTIWHAPSGRELQTMLCKGIVYTVDLSGNEELLVTGDQSHLAVAWDVATGCLVQRFQSSDVVKRVDLSGDNRLLAIGAGSCCELWDVASGSLIETRDVGGRVKMSSDSSLLVTVDTMGTLLVRRIADPTVPGFWIEMAAGNPTALAGLADVLPSYELLLNAPLESGRLLVAHAAAASNTPLVRALYTSTIYKPVPSSVLHFDNTGRHALDFALKTRNAALAELLLAQVLKLPPSARMGLVESPHSRGGDPKHNKSALVVMAALFPHALARQLTLLGIDKYIDTTENAFRRVREERLSCENGKMAVCGGSHPFNDDSFWQTLSGEDGEGQYSPVRCQLTMDALARSTVPQHRHCHRDLSPPTSCSTPRQHFHSRFPPVAHLSVLHTARPCPSRSPSDAASMMLPSVCVAQFQSRTMPTVYGSFSGFLLPFLVDTVLPALSFGRGGQSQSSVSPDHQSRSSVNPPVRRKPTLSRQPTRRFNFKLHQDDEDGADDENDVEVVCGVVGESPPSLMSKALVPSPYAKPSCLSRGPPLSARPADHVCIWHVRILVSLDPSALCHSACKQPWMEGAHDWEHGWGAW